MLNFEDWCWKTPVTFGALNAFSPVWFLSCFVLSNLILRSSYHTLCICVSSFQETRCGIAHITECACRGPINILLVIWLRAAVVPFGAPKLFLSPVSPLVNFKTEVERLLSHLLHWNGFSLVWVLLCFFLSNLILRSSYHTLCTWRASHLCDLSPVLSRSLMWNSS